MAGYSGYHAEETWPDPIETSYSDLPTPTAYTILEISRPPSFPICIGAYDGINCLTGYTKNKLKSLL